MAFWAINPLMDAPICCISVTHSKGGDIHIEMYTATPQEVAPCLHRTPL